MDNKTLQADALGVMQSILQIANAAVYNVKGVDMKAINQQFANMEQLVGLLQDGVIQITYTESSDDHEPDKYARSNHGNVLRRRV